MPWFERRRSSGIAVASMAWTGTTAFGKVLELSQVERVRNIHLIGCHEIDSGSEPFESSLERSSVVRYYGLRASWGFSAAPDGTPQTVHVD